MTSTHDKIASALETTFAQRGFAEPSVNQLRDAAGVSLRTLYKYMPSRRDMVLAALESRHERYMAHIFTEELPSGNAALSAILTRVVSWMQREAGTGCLFHAAVLAMPDDRQIHERLVSHKDEFTDRAVRQAGVQKKRSQFLIISEGLTQTWPVLGNDALKSAKTLASRL